MTKVQNTLYKMQTIKDLQLLNLLYVKDLYTYGGIR